MQGATVNFGTLFTQGAQGLRLESGQLSVLDAISGWKLDAGDLQSDLWGTGSGLRYGWHAGPDRQPSLTLYLPGTQASNPNTVLSYREEVWLKPDLRLGSEIATDGSFLVKQHYQDRRLDLETYYRHTANNSQDGLGAFLSVAFIRGISLYGNFSHTDGTGIAGDTQTVGLRVPLRTGTDVTLERTDLTSPTAKSTATALMLMTPLGPVRLLTRYQWTQSQTSAFGRFVGIERQYQDLHVRGWLLSRRAGKLRLPGQHPLAGGRTPGLSAQLVGTLRLSARTQLQLLSDFPNVLNSDKLHLRWNQTLSKRTALSLDYGLLSPYQNSRLRGNERGLMLMLHSHWDEPTVARGSEVIGRVLDPLGHGIKDAGVRLGGYQMLTDMQGRYRFRHVPAGAYELGLMEENLPTDYKADSAPIKLTLDGRARRMVDLHALPLRMIGGRVWWDKNGNGSFEPGEGMKNIVLHLDDAVTMTGDDGSFAFYNIAPGRYTLRVDLERLPADFTVVSPLRSRSISHRISRLPIRISG